MVAAAGEVMMIFTFDDLQGGTATWRSLPGNRYTNLTAYAERMTKLAGNKTWQDLLATFPATNYRISYTALSTAAAL